MNINNAQTAVKAFHGTMGIEIENTPMAPSRTVASLRVRLIREELEELRDAMQKGNVVEIADAIGDLLYVVLGTAVSCGIQSGPVFDEVHRSNMTKQGGYRDDGGKWIKPDTYDPAKLRPILEAQGWTPRRCPTCDSPRPGLHPAMQLEGEVNICKDVWHGELPEYVKPYADRIKVPHPPYCGCTECNKQTPIPR
jgi:predicted HAD superfamily Cof-like phosphohydrolase